jgi:hypothetical protein
MQAHEPALKPHPVDLLAAPVSSGYSPQDAAAAFAARLKTEALEVEASFVLGIMTADDCQEATAQWRVNAWNWKMDYVERHARRTSYNHSCVAM